MPSVPTEGVRPTSTGGAPGQRCSESTASSVARQRTESVAQGVTRKPTRRRTAQKEQRFNAKSMAVCERPPRRTHVPLWRRVRKSDGGATATRHHSGSDGACAALRAGRKRKSSTRARPAPGSPRPLTRPSSPRRPGAHPAVGVAHCRPRSHGPGAPRPRRFPCSAPPSAPASATRPRGGSPARASSLSLRGGTLASYSTRALVGSGSKHSTFSPEWNLNFMPSLALICSSWRRARLRGGRSARRGGREWG